jgi:hypothetical protein
MSPDALVGGRAGLVERLERFAADVMGPARAAHAGQGVS